MQNIRKNQEPKSSTEQASERYLGRRWENTANTKAQISLNYAAYKMTSTQVNKVTVLPTVKVIKQFLLPKRWKK